MSSPKTHDMKTRNQAANDDGSAGFAEPLCSAASEHHFWLMKRVVDYARMHVQTNDMPKNLPLAVALRDYDKDCSDGGKADTSRLAREAERRAGSNPAPSTNEKNLAMMLGRVIRAARSGDEGRIALTCSDAEDLIVRLGVLSPLKGKA